MPMPPEARVPQDAVAGETTQRRYSGWWRRAFALIVDNLVMYIPALIAGIPLFLAGEDDLTLVETLSAIVFFVLVFVFPFVYFTAFHASERGQTPGKRLMRIAVRSSHGGGRLSYGEAFGRYFIVFVFGILAIPFVIDYLWPLFDKRNQSLHDKMVSSIVVRV